MAFNLIKDTSSQARAYREVIMAAGAINTPKILMLSGLGPKDHLSAQGIDTVVSLPQLGSNAQDHIFPAMTFEMKENITTVSQWNNKSYFKEIERLYKTKHTGELSSDLGGAQAAERVPDHVLKKLNASYQLSLPKDRNHIEYLFDSIQFADPTTKRNVSSQFILHSRKTLILLFRPRL